MAALDDIRLPSMRGINVVQLASTGSETLNDLIYNAPAPRFPANWRNSFNWSDWARDAIMVGHSARNAWPRPRS